MRRETILTSFAQKALMQEKKQDMYIYLKKTMRRVTKVN